MKPDDPGDRRDFLKGAVASTFTGVAGQADAQRAAPAARFNGIQMGPHTRFWMRASSAAST